MRVLLQYTRRLRIIGGMYHYDPAAALEELTEDATLPHPVHIRDMMLRTGLNPGEAVELNHLFQEYLKTFGEAQRLGRSILEELVRRREEHAGKT